MIKRMDHLGVVVNDLEAATAFFVELGLELTGQGAIEGALADRVVALEGIRTDNAWLKTPDGHSQLELSKFHSPASSGGDGGFVPANTPGIRHVAFLVDDLDAALAGLRDRGTELVGEVVRFEGMYRVCFVRGPEGIIVELAEELS